MKDRDDEIQRLKDDIEKIKKEQIEINKLKNSSESEKDKQIEEIQSKLKEQEEINTRMIFGFHLCYIFLRFCGDLFFDFVVFEQRKNHK